MEKDNPSADSVKASLSTARIIFWDFDGVIKDSNNIKSDAFYRLFAGFGNTLASRIRAHHEVNTGQSRYEKIPIYLGWCDIEPDENLVAQYARRFAELVCDGVIESDWVPGVVDYIRANRHTKKMFLLTATPHTEIKYILQRLGIEECFAAVFGYPTDKRDGMKSVLINQGCPPGYAVMVGDSIDDFRAAEAIDVPFILRSTSENAEQFKAFKGCRFTSLTT